jgi:DNA-binding response OmpR family regulator
MIMASPGLDLRAARADSRVIVWCDDDPSLLSAFRCVLNDHGFPNVYVAATLEGSLHLIERLTPDLVITDMYKEHSRTDGAYVARVVRGSPSLAHTRLILATGAEEWRDRWSDLFDCFLLKPFRIESAVEAIRGLLRSVV